MTIADARPTRTPIAIMSKTPDLPCNLCIPIHSPVRWIDKSVQAHRHEPCRLIRKTLFPDLCAMAFPCVARSPFSRIAIEQWEWEAANPSKVMKSKRLKSTWRELVHHHCGATENWHVGVRYAALRHVGAISTSVFTPWCERSAPAGVEWHGRTIEKLVGNPDAEGHLGEHMG